MVCKQWRNHPYGVSVLGDNKNSGVYFHHTTVDRSISAVKHIMGNWFFGKYLCLYIRKSIADLDYRTVGLRV